MRPFSFGLFRGNVGDIKQKKSLTRHVVRMVLLQRLNKQHDAIHIHHFHQSSGRDILITSR